MKVRLAPQVADFFRRLAPEPRRRMPQALRDLEKGKGDVKALEGPLQLRQPSIACSPNAEASSTSCLRMR
jgi:hypothetical protein